MIRSSLIVEGRKLKHLCQAAMVALLVASPTFAPDASVLLDRVSKNYRDLRSFEFYGHLTAVIPDTKLVFYVQTADAAAGPGFVALHREASKRFEAHSFRESKITDADGQKPKTPLGPATISMPASWLGEKLSEGIKSAKELPREVLKVDGIAIDCAVVEVAYDRPEWKPEERTVRYWIDEKRLILVKQEFSEFQRHNKKTMFWHWVYQLDSVKLNQPPPEWLIESLKSPHDADHNVPKWIGRDAPQFTLPDLDERQVSLKAMRGKVLVLSFWATWCAPCIAEMPALERIVADYKVKGVELWGVSSEGPSVVKEWLSQNQKSFRTLVDADGDTAEEYQLEGIPTLVVIGRDGKIRSYYTGNQTEQSLRTAIDSVLRESLN
jgi:peroxiredoxin